MHLEAVVPAYNLDTEEALVVIQLLQALSAGRGREARFYIDLPHAANLKVVILHHTSADEWLVLLRLVKPPHQGPHLHMPPHSLVNKNVGVSVYITIVHFKIERNLVSFHISYFSKWKPVISIRTVI